MSDRLLTQTEVCRILGISRKTLQNLRSRRAIGYVQFGHRTIRFRESQVERYISNRERPVVAAQEIPAPEAIA